jgi:hypothetical protein
VGGQADERLSGGERGGRDGLDRPVADDDVPRGLTAFGLARDPVAAVLGLGRCTGRAPQQQRDTERRGQAGGRGNGVLAELGTVERHEDRRDRKTGPGCSQLCLAHGRGLSS